MATDGGIGKTFKDLEKEMEVERVMKSFKLNPYDVLDLSYGATDSQIKSHFRKKSVLIHPDKFKHENGEAAFDFLKKAESHLSDPGKRNEIDAIMKHARTQVLQKVLGSGFSTNVSEDDSRIANLKPPLDAQIRIKAKEILVDDELSRRRKTKLAHANEGADRARQEAEVSARKRKVEEQQKWEERRDERVSSWRDFSKKAAKKSKKDSGVLG